VRWAKQYEGTRDRYNSLAREAAEAVVRAILPDSGASAAVPTPATSSAAELALQQGDYETRRWWSTADKADLDRARAAYHQALELDPSLALAAVGLANLRMRQYVNEGGAQQALQEAESWTRRALGIDPRCGPAWAALSDVEGLRPRPDPERGLDYAVKAVAFAPGDASGHASVGSWASAPGSFSVAAAAMRHSFELAPIHADFAANAASFLTILGRPEQALPLIDRALRAEPGHVFAPIVQAYALIRLGRLEEAATALQRCEAAATARQKQGEIWREAKLRLAVAQRDIVTAEALARQVVALALDPQADSLTVYNAMDACGPLAQMGRTDEAMRILRRAVDVGAAPAYDWLSTDPDIQLLRRDPRFSEVLAASRDGAAMVARVLGQARSRGELPKYLEEPLEDLQKLLSGKGPKA
jgi:tetratricopeptide (TPR) repeat protein